jgi:hypothetical protein
MICIIADHLHLLENSFVEALRRPVVRSRDGWRIRDELRIKDELRSSVEQMKIITHPKLLTTRQRTASLRIISHPCSRVHHRCILQFMSYHPLLHRPLRKIIRWMIANRESVSIIHPHLPLRLESPNVRRERWMLTKTMMTKEKRIRRAVLSRHRHLGLVLQQEKPRLHLQVA